MSSRLEYAKQPVSRTFAGPRGHPFHPILVTVPIGAWTSSLIFDIASHIVDEPGFLSQGSQWLIAIGGLAAIVAAVIGFLDLLVVPPSTPAFTTGLWHMSLNLLVIAAYVANFLWRFGEYGDPTAVGIGPLVLSAVSIAALAVSGYLGGKLAYRYGVRVVSESDQIDGYRS